MLQYVNMVLAGLVNSVAKSVVHCQVREAKRGLLDHFFVELGQKKVSYPSFMVKKHHFAGLKAPIILQKKNDKMVEIGRKVHICIVYIQCGWS